MIKIDDHPILSRNISTLKDTSLDFSKGINMVESQLNVVNFDLVKNEYIAGFKLDDTPKSNDALFIGTDGNATFIEFKNGCIGKKDVYDIKGKIYDSVLILTGILKKGIDYISEHVDYILVYNKDANPSENEDVINPPSLDNIALKLHSFAGKEFERYGLKNKFEKYLFRKVHTYTVSEFETNFINKN